MSILVINSGSSSIKFACIGASTGEHYFTGQISGIGTDLATYEVTFENDTQKKKTPIHDHGQAIKCVVKLIEKLDFNISAIRAIGHRVVHGGNKLIEPSLIDDTCIEQIESVSALAPLHNPANLAGIRACQRIFPDLPQVAVFDTAFHRTIPEVAHRYAINREIADKYQVRKYGFHGISHEYIAHSAANRTGKTPNTINLISCHLGNGASITAIKAGESVDTSMGLTPLAGLIMGTRSGDIDPGIMDYLGREAKLSLESLHKLLNTQSGLKGIAQESADMRTLTKLADAGHAGAQLAIDMFCYRLARYIGSYFILVAPIDCLVFTGGIGENSTLVRKNTLKRIEILGFQIDEERNNAPEDTGLISRDASTPVYVIKTNEEWQIAKSTQAVIGDRP